MLFGGLAIARVFVLILLLGGEVSHFTILSELILILLVGVRHLNPHSIAASLILTSLRYLDLAPLKLQVVKITPISLRASLFSLIRTITAADLIIIAIIKPQIQIHLFLTPTALTCLY